MAMSYRSAVHGIAAQANIGLCRCYTDVWMTASDDFTQQRICVAVWRLFGVDCSVEDEQRIRGCRRRNEKVGLITLTWLSALA